MTSVLLVGRSHEYEQRIRSVFGASLRAVVSGFKHVDLSALAEQAAQGPDPDLILIGPALAHADARTLTEAMRRRYPEARVTLVREHDVAEPHEADGVVSPGADKPELLRLLPASLSSTALNPPDLDAPSIADPAPTVAGGTFLDPPRADDLVAAEPPVEAVDGRIIAVVSPKGGQGKTTTAVNLAVALARVAPSSVVLVDADMQFGDVANMLDIVPAHTLPELVSGVAPNDALVLKTLLTPHAEGFYIVPGATSPVEGDQVTDEQLDGLLQQLATMFRFVVVDTTPGLGEHTLSALDNATDGVFVTGLAVPNLRAMRTELDVLGSIGAIPPQRHIVLNMADERAGMRTKDAEDIIGVPVSVVVPRSIAVPLAANRGVPLLVDAPRDAAAKALLGLVPRLVADADPKLLRSRRRKAQA